MITIGHTLVAGAFVALASTGMAVAGAESSCDPDTMAMSPQPVLSCPGVAAAPFPDTAPVPDPAFDVTGPPTAGSPPASGPVIAALPAPGQAPHVPPVVGADGTQSFGQGGVIGDLFTQFQNGVPTDLIYGPVAPPPGS